jgi:hypothetical protein
VGVDKRGAVNGGGDFSIRQGKINVSASTMVNQMKPRTSGVTDQLNFYESPARAFHQETLIEPGVLLCSVNLVLIIL